MVAGYSVLTIGEGLYINVFNFTTRNEIISYRYTCKSLTDKYPWKESQHVGRWLPKSIKKTR